MTILSTTDKALLKALTFNARKSYSQLGRESNLSKQGAEYAMRKLERKGIIKGYNAILDLNKLGFLYGRFYISLKNINSQQLDTLCEKIAKNEHYHWILTMQGKYDLGIGFWVNSLERFSDLLQETSRLLGVHALNVDETIGQSVTHCNYRYIYGGDYDERKTNSSIKIKVDDIDLHILELLVKDARIPIHEIATTLGISGQVVAYRIKQLEKKKIILGYSPIIDFFSLGFSYMKLLIQLNAGTLSEIPKIHAYLKTQKEVIYIVEKIGTNAPLDIKILVKDGKELYEFMSRLRSQFPQSIQNYDSLLFIKTIKAEFFPKELRQKKEKR